MESNDEIEKYKDFLSVYSAKCSIESAREFRGIVHNTNVFSFMIGGICSDRKACKIVCQQLQDATTHNCFVLISTKPGEKKMDVLNYINGKETLILETNVMLFENVDEEKNPEPIPSLLDDTLFKEIQPYIKAKRNLKDLVTPTSVISNDNNVLKPGQYFRGWFETNGVQHHFAIELVDPNRRFRKIYVDNIQFSGEKIIYYLANNLSSC